MEQLWNMTTTDWWFGTFFNFPPIAQGWNRIASFPPPLFDLSSCGLPQRWVMADEDQAVPSRWVEICFDQLGYI